MRCKKNQTNESNSKKKNEKRKKKKEKNQKIEAKNLIEETKLEFKKQELGLELQSNEVFKVTTTKTIKLTPQREIIARYWLPYDIWNEIFAYLNPMQIAKISGVCKLFYTIATERLSKLMAAVKKTNRRMLRPEILLASCFSVLNESIENRRNFVESIEIDINLVKYNPNVHRRFYFPVYVPNEVRPKGKFCLFGNNNNLVSYGILNDTKVLSSTDLFNFKKDQKELKKFAKPIHRIFC